jgi:hypothetical protein
MAPGYILTPMAKSYVSERLCDLVMFGNKQIKIKENNSRFFIVASKLL